MTDRVRATRLHGPQASRRRAGWLLTMRILWSSGIGAAIGVVVALVLAPDCRTAKLHDGHNLAATVFLPALFYTLPGMVVFWEFPFPAAILSVLARAGSFLVKRAQARTRRGRRRPLTMTRIAAARDCPMHTGDA